MKVLKYGWALLLGLSLSVCGSAPLLAQAAGQSREVVPQNPNPLPEVPEVDAATQATSQDEYYDALRTPAFIDNLIGQGKYAEAVTELGKYVKSGEGDVCHRLFMAHQTYFSLMNFDPAQAAEYAQKQNEVKAELAKKCANSAVAYIMKAQESQGQPEAVVALMTKAIAVDSTLTMCYALRGNALWQLNRAKEACADFAKGAETGDPAMVNLYNGFCRVFIMMEEEPAPAE